MRAGQKFQLTEISKARTQKSYSILNIRFSEIVVEIEGMAHNYIMDVNNSHIFQSLTRIGRTRTQFEGRRIIKFDRCVVKPRISLKYCEKERIINYRLMRARCLLSPRGCQCCYIDISGH